MASEDLKLHIHTARTPESAQNTAHSNRKHRKTRRMRIKTRLSFQERLLRNSCVACAVLLGVLALDNLQQPWAVSATRHIQQALTMEVDLDQSLGELHFVRKLVPESALVFFNVSGGHEFCLPVNGELSHAFSNAQPWLMFSCESESPVCAVADGTVSAVSTLSDGSMGIMIDHGNGVETVMANLREVTFQQGDHVPRGGIIGRAGDNLYFELRQNGEVADPSERLGL